MSYQERTLEEKRKKVKESTITAGLKEVVNKANNGEVSIEAGNQAQVFLSRLPDVRYKDEKEANLKAAENLLKTSG
jgi:hypothetical protein